jgi:hypothetical protein
MKVKRDANHHEIADALRDIGVYVVDCAHVGGGFPDLLCAWRSEWKLVEIKRDDVPPSASKLQLNQILFQNKAAERGCKVYTVRSIDDALAIFGARRGA